MRVLPFSSFDIGENRRFVVAGFRSITPAGLLIGLALSLGGCATAIPLPSFIATKEDPDVTGSIRQPSALSPSPLSPSLDSEDWRRAKGAMSVALDPQGNGMPVSWDNPKSGAKGVFRPVGEAKPVDDKICRSFVADLSGSHPEQSLQGTACRDNGGDWALGPVTPWKKA